VIEEDRHVSTAFTSATYTLSGRVLGEGYKMLVNGESKIRDTGKYI